MGATMKTTIGEAWPVLKQTVSEWVDDKAPQLGAALAFYSILSLAPLLVIVITIAGAVFGADAAQSEIVAQMERLVGRDGAEAVEEMIAHAQQPETGVTASVVGVVTLLLGASGVFGQLQDTLNTIWNVKPKPGRGIGGFLRDRFLSFAMVLGTGFLLLVSLVLSATLASLGKFLSGLLPGAETLWLIVNEIVSFAVIAVLFGLIFKLVPDVKTSWKDIWVGAALTALLFTVGKFVLGLYLGRQSVGSAYGAAGSFVVLVIWIYYSAQILFFGAELTQVYAQRYGSRIVPDENAQWTTDSVAPREVPAVAARDAARSST